MILEQITVWVTDRQLLTAKSFRWLLGIGLVTSQAMGGSYNCISSI
jgi:hypothetical protein